ncbi:MAG: hypothetical protein EP338_00030 [Bacteroidetes bacterium]|nr:MAG: hypothetical protein EP338_00030 [Bacteroidota bacterium]
MKKKIIRGLLLVAVLMSTIACKKNKSELIELTIIDEFSKAPITNLSLEFEAYNEGEQALNVLMTGGESNGNTYKATSDENGRLCFIVDGEDRKAVFVPQQILTPVEYDSTASAYQYTVKNFGQAAPDQGTILLKPRGRMRFVLSDSTALEWEEVQVSAYHQQFTLNGSQTISAFCYVVPSREYEITLTYRNGTEEKLITLKKFISASASQEVVELQI